MYSAKACCDGQWLQLVFLAFMFCRLAVGFKSGYRTTTDLNLHLQEKLKPATMFEMQLPTWMFVQEHITGMSCADFRKWKSEFEKFSNQWRA
jgi:hypothetical protein